MSDKAKAKADTKPKQGKSQEALGLEAVIAELVSAAVTRHYGAQEPVAVEVDGLQPVKADRSLVSRARYRFGDAEHEAIVHLPVNVVIGDIRVERDLTLTPEEALAEAAVE